MAVDLDGSALSKNVIGRLSKSGYRVKTFFPGIEAALAAPEYKDDNFSCSPAGFKKGRRRQKGGVGFYQVQEFSTVGTSVTASKIRRAITNVNQN